MTDFKTHTIDSAPAASKPLLEGAQSAFGFVPNLLAGMAEAPALLEGYMGLAGIFDKTDLDVTERQIILMTNNRLNGCDYCMAAHTVIAEGQGVPDCAIEVLRSGGAFPEEKAKYEALRQFTITINESRGWPSECAVKAFLAAGYTQQTVLEVILGTSLKLMSNYTNHVMNTPLDEQFQPKVWSEAVCDSEVGTCSAGTCSSEAA